MGRKLFIAARALELCCRLLGQITRWRLYHEDCQQAISRLYSGHRWRLSLLLKRWREGTAARASPVTSRPRWNSRWNSSTGGSTGADGQPAAKQQKLAADMVSTAAGGAAPSGTAAVAQQPAGPEASGAAGQAAGAAAEALLLPDVDPSPIQSRYIRSAPSHMLFPFT